MAGYGIIDDNYANRLRNQNTAPSHTLSIIKTARTPRILLVTNVLINRTSKWSTYAPQRVQILKRVVTTGPLL